MERTLPKSAVIALWLIAANLTFLTGQALVGTAHAKDEGGGERELVQKLLDSIDCETVVNRTCQVRIKR